MKRYLLTLGSNSTGSSGARANDTCNGLSVTLIYGRVLLRFLKVGRLSNTKPMYRLATALSVRSVAKASPSRLVSLLDINSLGKFNTGISHCMLSVAFSWQRYTQTQIRRFSHLETKLTRYCNYCGTKHSWILNKGSRSRRRPTTKVKR